jgi:hypothetical protein
MAVHRLRTTTQTPGAESLADRMERLRADAGLVANEHIAAMVKALSEAVDLAEQVANGGEAYQIGVREIARRMHKDLAPTVLSLRAVCERTLP